MKGQADLVAFLLALAVTWLCTPLVRKLALRLGVVAVPRDRDVHTHTMPRWGGIAIYLGVLVAVLITVSLRHLSTHGENGWNDQLIGVLIAGTFIALIGMLDDMRDLSAAVQALAILGAGALLIMFKVRITGFGNPLVGEIPGGMYNPAGWVAFSMPVSVLVTLFWVFLVTKTVDAIDGLDGLAAGVCAISAGTLALMAASSHQQGGPTIALLAAAIAGSCIGFLKHNYNPAKIFMSTVGSQFLGLMLAAISVMGTFKIAAAVSVLVPVLVLGVPIFDYGIVLTRRLVCHAPLTAADRRHLHHRLLDRGLSQKQACWVIYGCTVALCSVALILFHYHVK